MRTLFLFILSFALFTPPAQAASVKTIDENGILELQSGEKICLAGIELPSESIRLLSSLVAGRKIDIDYAKTAKTQNLKSAYLYITTPVFHFPPAANAKPEQKKIMVNEFLLSIGAAKVGEAEKKWKDRFEKIQLEARRRGEGIWSYDLDHAGLKGKPRQEGEGS